MIVHVRLFAAARQLAGVDFIDVELPDGATVAELRKRLIVQHAMLEPILRSSAFAVDTEYAVESTKLAAASDVACIPPVSGG